MPCFKPIDGYLAKGGGITFKKSTSLGQPMSVPCGQCIGCRIDKAKEWAARLSHEARGHSASVFLTLTYADDHVPLYGSLSLRDTQLFLKRLRKHLGTQKIRYFNRGEYGPQTLRPHYHLIVFGYASSDRKLWKRGKDGHLYNSPTLDKLWGKGFVTESDITEANINYVARYCIDKLNGEKADKHYTRVHPYTGESVLVLPEFARMSTRPGIGHSYFEKYKKALWDHDSIVIEGREGKVPRYYDKLRRRENEPAALSLRDARLARSRTKEARANNTPARLASREKFQRSRLNLKKTREL